MLAIVRFCNSLQTLATTVLPALSQYKIHMMCNAILQAARRTQCRSLVVNRWRTEELFYTATYIQKLMGTCIPLVT